MLLTDEKFSGFDLSRREETSGVLDRMICLPELSAACSGFKEKLVSLKAQSLQTRLGVRARLKEAEGLRPMVCVAQAGCCVDTLRLVSWSAFPQHFAQQVGGLTADPSNLCKKKRQDGTTLCPTCSGR